MSRYARTLLLLAILHVALMGVSLDRLPGLLGDEGSEGENVWKILDTKQLTVYGERSYIGPLIDYVRVPFILAFGYTTLALRVPIVLFSVATFFLAAAVFRKIFGEAAALYMVAALFFSPIYLLYQRLGWAITLIPFFAILIVWLLQRRSPYRFLWAGVAAGIGLHNHFIFFPTLITLLVVWLGSSLLHERSKILRWAAWVDRGRALLMAATGFLAGFSTQLAVLLTQRDDQGDAADVAHSFYERLVQLPEILPKFLSGSIFSAFYTGEPLTDVLIFTLTALLVGFIAAALFWSEHKPATTWWFLGTILQLLVLVVIIDRFAARYLVVPLLSAWALAGYGAYLLINKATRHRPLASAALPILLALVLAVALTAPAWVSFWRTGGSTRSVAITAARREPAAAFVDIRALLTCVRNRGPMYSESVHIYNRLLYLSYQYLDLNVTDNAANAAYTVSYRDDEQVEEESLCPNLVHFRVL